MGQYTEKKRRSKNSLLHGCSMAHFENKKTLEKPVFSRVFEEIKMRRKGLPGNTETHRNDVFSRLFEGFDRRNIPDNARCLLHICSTFLDQMHFLDRLVGPLLSPLGDVVVNLAGDLARSMSKPAGNDLQINAGLGHQGDVSVAEDVRGDFPAQNPQ